MRLCKGARFTYEYEPKIHGRHVIRIEDSSSPAAKLPYLTGSGGQGGCPPRAAMGA